MTRFCTVADAPQTGAFITGAAPAARILAHAGQPNELSPIADARRPPDGDDAYESVPDWDLLKQTEPDFEFDRRVSWQPLCPFPRGNGVGPLAPDGTLRLRCSPQCPPERARPHGARTSVSPKFAR